MKLWDRISSSFIVATLSMVGGSALADTVIYNNDFPDGRVATTSGSVNGKETESADDFNLATQSQITSGSFTGLIPKGAKINSVGIEIYKVFPNDSTNPPSPIVVPTRTNSPADVAFKERSTVDGNLSYTASLLNNNIGVANSIVNNISPGMTGGEGGKNGQEVRFDFTASNLILPADHYFFIPQVELSDGTFLWLSAPKPSGSSAVFGSTPTTPDLQSWVRNQDLDPNWLRVGTDIIGADATHFPNADAAQYNAAFRLVGTAVVPEPATIAMLIAGIGLLGWMRLRKSENFG